MWNNKFLTGFAMPVGLEDDRFLKKKKTFYFGIILSVWENYRQVENLSTLHPASPNTNIIHNHGIFVKTKESMWYNTIY